MAFTGGESFIFDLDDPWKDCQFGDQSNHIYGAEGNWPADLFTARRTMTVLRHRETYHRAEGRHDTRWTKTNTAYLTFVRVR